MTAARALVTPLLLASASGLGACAVGPGYRPPEISTVAKEPFKEAATGVDSAAPVSSAWWKLHSDPTLSRLIEDAFRYNTDIRVAAANLRLARAQLSEARAGRLSTTDLTASCSRQRVGTDQIGPAARGIGTSDGASGGADAASAPGHYDSSFYEAGFDASYELDVFGRASRSIEVARGDAQAALDESGSRSRRR
jgi:outer membrane protein TolC